MGLGEPKRWNSLVINTADIFRLSVNQMENDRNEYDNQYMSRFSIQCRIYRWTLLSERNQIDKILRKRKAMATLTLYRKSKRPKMSHEYRATIRTPNVNLKRKWMRTKRKLVHSARMRLWVIAYGENELYLFIETESRAPTH